MSAPFVLARLASSHRLDNFACGDPEIDAYLKDRAIHEQSQGLNAVFVAVDHEGAVQGYFTLSPLSLRVDAALLGTLTSADIAYPSVGGYLLGRLGVALPLAHQGMGRALVSRALDIAKAQRESTGGVFLAVDPKEDWLVSWYAKLGFKQILPPKRRMIHSLL